jgi:hypothetical protein
VRADCLKVKGSRDDFDIVERELAALRNDLAVECDEGGTIVVESVSVATLLIGVKVDSAELEKGAQSTAERHCRPDIHKPFQSPPE